MTLVSPPIPSRSIRSRLPTPAAMLALAETLVGTDARVLFHGVPWAHYRALLDLQGDDARPKLHFDRGTLEIEMPSITHDMLKTITGDFLANYMQEFEIDYLGTGEGDLKRKDVKGGVRPDEAFYVQSYRSVAGKKINLAVDPPPDLALEVDLSPPALRKASIYARLGVPEIWRWRHGKLTVLERQPNATGGHTYVKRERSVALPGFPLDQLAAELARSPHAEQAEAGRAFRKWCRAQAEAAKGATP